MAQAFAAEQVQDGAGNTVEIDEQDDTVAVNAGSSGASWTLEPITVHPGSHPDLRDRLATENLHQSKVGNHMAAKARRNGEAAA